MGFTVVADDARPVHTENDVQLLQGNVVQEHVIGPLQKTGVNGEHRDQPLLRHACRHGDSVPFGDTHIEKPGGKMLGKGE